LQQRQENVQKSQRVYKDLRSKLTLANSSFCCIVFKNDLLDLFNLSPKGEGVQNESYYFSSSLSGCVTRYGLRSMGYQRTKRQ
ncbi:hypothetical protein KC730_00005, partial [Candidatus Kaiserbacteria bacterium]|nr:hypothetical protein [Candidatus Kaiserbacteria bacterium]